MDLIEIEDNQLGIPIFCINLNHSIKRKQSIQKNWIENLGFDIQFWNATNKTDPIIESIDKKSPFVHDRELKIGEIALSISYTKLLEHIMSKNLDEVIIIEDDTFPNPILSIIKNTNNIPDLLFQYIRLCKNEFGDMQLLQLHKHNFHNTFFIQNELEYCYIPNYGYWGAVANYFSKDGIQSMYEGIKNHNIVIDHYWNIPGLQNKIAISKMSFFLHCQNCSNYFQSEAQ